MLKIKLYSADTPISKEYLLEQLFLKQYSDSTGYGFEIIKNDTDLVAQFIERQITKQKLEFPDGEVSEIETVSYIKVKFGIRFNSKLTLYVINPPRSMKYPFEMIRALFDVDSGLKPIELDLKKLLSVFSSKYDYVIKSMSLSNIQCDASTIATSKLVSSKDLNSFFLKNYYETSALVDTARLVMNGVDIELSRTGRFRTCEEDLKNTLLVLEHSLY